MSRQDFISGSILEFKVAAKLGYAYCKILDFRYIRMFDGVLCKVYDHIVQEPIRDIEVLRDKEWLFGARRMPWLPGTRGKGAWKMKGVLISDNDNNIPDFKYCNKFNPSPEQNMIFGTWDVIRNINEYFPCAYDHVKHLEDGIVSTTLGIEVRTTMEYCRQNQFNVEEYFDLSETINERIFKQMMHIPIYKNIPKELRGKAAC